VTRYDVVLALIPVAFVTTILVAHVVGLTVQTALTVAALAGAVGVADALFLNPPTGGRRSNR
jgi:hypothetical protein